MKQSPQIFGNFITINGDSGQFAGMPDINSFEELTFKR